MRHRIEVSICLPTRRAGTRKLVSITSPEDGAIAPAAVTDPRVEGVVSRPDIESVVVERVLVEADLRKRLVVAVEDGRFHAILPFDGDALTVDLRAAGEPHGRPDDRIRVCREPYVPWVPAR